MAAERRPGGNDLTAAEVASARAELGVDAAASWGQVIRARRLRLRQAHPDVSSSRPEFDRVVTAFEVLSRHYGHEDGQASVAADDHRRQVDDEIAGAELLLQRLRREVSAAAARRAEVAAEVRDAADRCFAYESKAEEAEARTYEARQAVANAEARYAQEQTRADEEENRYRQYRRHRWRRRAFTAGLMLVTVVGVHRVTVESELVAPTDVTAVPDATGVTVAWQDAYAGESGFEVSVSGDRGDFLLRVSADTTDARWGLPAVRETYCFQVRAYRDSTAAPRRWAEVGQWIVPWQQPARVPPWRETWVSPWSPVHSATCVRGGD